MVHLNANDPPDMNRFTAFHEGFHIVCRNSGLAFSQRDDFYQPVSERLADYFAASILMPRALVYEVWPEVQSLSKMATTFDVPELIMRDWLTRLRL